MRVNITLPGLIHLAHTKNEINRKRRRFYSFMNDSYTYSYGEKGYEQAKQEMKQLTPDMRQICNLIGAKFRWGNSGNIQGVYYRDQYIPASSFKQISEDYMAEAILLGFGR